jgi:hypothetical protein
MGQDTPWEVQGRPLVTEGHGALLKMPRRNTTLLRLLFKISTATVNKAGFLLYLEFTQEV